MINIELAEKVLAKITEHPELHDQTIWADSWGSSNICDTTACIAGHALLLSSGYTFDSETDAFTSIETGRIVSFEEEGAKLLGLRRDGDEINRLFYADTEADAVAILRDMIDKAKAGQRRAHTHG